MKEEKKVLLGYQKISNYKAILRNLRVFKGVTATQRAELKVQIDYLEDLTLGIDTKIKNLKEVYQEQKAHKSFVEDAEKAKILIGNYHVDVDAAVKDFGEKEIVFKPIFIDESIFESKKDESQDDITEKIINRNGFLELEGILLMSASADDGGEPKKPGGR
jgi:predicted phage-related endonuclease